MSPRIPLPGVPDAWATTWRGPALLAAVVGLAVAGFTGGLELRTDLSRMLPDDSPRAEAFARFAAAGGPGEWLALRVAGPPEEGRRFAGRVRDGWLELPEVEVPRRPEPRDLLPLFPSPRDRERWRRELYAVGDESFEARLRRQLRRLRVGGLAASGEAFAADPFGVLIEAAAPWIDSLENIAADPELAGAESGIVIDGSDVWVLLWSRVPAGAAPPEFLERLRSVVRKMSMELPGVTAELIGGYRYRELAESGLRDELTKLLPIAVAGVLVVLTLGMGSWLAPITCLVPLVVALGLLFGAFHVAGLPLRPGHLAAMILIVGLAVDAAIHLRVACRGGPGSGFLSWIAAGHGIRAAVATSTVGFAVLLFSSFSVLRELGALVPAGLLLSTALLWILFPTLHRWERRQPVAEAVGDPVTHAVEPGGVRPWAWAIAVLIVAAHFLPLGPLDFTGDLRAGDPWRARAIDPMLELGAVGWSWWSVTSANVPAERRVTDDRARLEHLLRENGVLVPELEPAIADTVAVMNGPEGVAGRLRSRGDEFLPVPSAVPPASLEAAGWVRVDAEALLEEVEARSRDELLQMGLWMLAGVVVLLALVLPSRRAIAVALFPPFVALAGTFLWVRLSGRSITPLGITLLPLLFGIGLDDALHLLLHRSGPGARRRVLRGVVVTTGTTIAAVGTLILSESPMLSALGALTIPAMLLACGATLFGIRGGGREARLQSERGGP